MWDDSEYDSWEDEDDWPESAEESPTVTCPECGGEVYEEADCCPYCGFYLDAASTHAFIGRPAWFVALGVIGILATILALSGLF